MKQNILFSISKMLMVFVLLIVSSKVVAQGAPPPPPCPNITVWNGSSWNNGVPDNQKVAIFDGDYSSSASIAACSVVVNNLKTITINSNHVLTVTNEVIIIGFGNLIFENGASLVQINNNALNSGNITYRRTTPPISRFDYTYWSSPVSDQKIGSLSSATLSDKFFYWDNALPSTDLANNISGNWHQIPSTDILTTPMDVGKGYLIRGPQDYDATLGTLFTGTFKGVPNNGIITTPITGQVYTYTPTANPCPNNPTIQNLIGNPYPSALDADSFLSDPLNVNVVGGAIYQWTHNTPVSSSIPNTAPGFYAYTSNDYTVYNRLGGVGTGRISNVAPHDFLNTNRPNGKIAAGQSFVIMGLSNGTATFTNEMRDNADGVNGQFYKSVSASSLVAPIVKNRIWVSIENTTSTEVIHPYRETLVGYATGATNGYDRAFDAPSATSNPIIDLYSLTNPNTVCAPLAIQGRTITTPFNPNDFIQLGFKATVTGGSQDFKIEAMGDGDFSTGGQPYYLQDTSLPMGSNIFNFPYTFTLTSSVTNNTRFRIVFTGPFLTNVQNSQCGATLGLMGDYVTANLVTGASQYQFSITNLTTAQNTIYTNSIRNFLFEFVAPIVNNSNPNNHFVTYNTTYSVQVRAMVNNIWQPWGKICNVTTPTFPTTQLIATQCGTTIPNKNTYILATNIFSVTIIPGNFTKRYNFRLSNGAYVSQIFENPSGFSQFQLSNIVGLIPSTSYNVEVAIKINGILGPWGPACTIFTPSVLKQSQNSSNPIELLEAVAYPNPFSTNLTLDLSTFKSKDLTIVVYDQLGKLIDTKKVSTLTEPNLIIGDNYLPGIYNIVIDDQEKIKTIRVIKK